MLISKDFKHLTTNQQKIMLLMYPKGRIKFENQNIYKNRQWFKKEMKMLINFNKVSKINKFSTDMRKNNESYCLSLLGKFLVETVLLKFDEMNATNK